MSGTGVRTVTVNGTNPDAFATGLETGAAAGVSDVPFSPEWIARCQITTERLSHFVSGSAQAKVPGYATALDSAKREGEITTPQRVAFWIAQLAVESGHFTRLEESLVYSAKRLAAVFPRLASEADAIVAQATRVSGKYDEAYVGNKIYAGCNGNGSEASGDGYKYRGRGFIQLTGRSNYAAYGKALGLDLVNNPDLASQPAVAARIAARFWFSHGCNALADAGDVTGVTQRINGGTNGLADRGHCTTLAKTIWK